MRDVDTFHVDTVKAMAQHVSQIAAKREEMLGYRKEAADQRKNGPDTRTEYHSKANTAHNELNNLFAAAKRESDRLCEAYRAEIDDADALNPSDMNDDIKLLNCGVVLPAHDLVRMLNRNNGNHTMCKLIMEYANQHKIAIKGNYVGFRKEREHVDTLQSEMRVIFNPMHYEIFDQTFKKAFYK